MDPLGSPSLTLDTFWSSARWLAREFIPRSFSWEKMGWESNFLPSGKRLHNYGKSPCYQWENPLFLWSFSIAMLVITRGYIFLWVMFSIAMLNYLRVSIDDNRCVCIGWFSTARLECRRIETSESRKSPQFQHFYSFFNSGWLKFLSTPGRTNGSYLWDGWFPPRPQIKKIILAMGRLFLLHFKGCKSPFLCGHKHLMFVWL